MKSSYYKSLCLVCAAALGTVALAQLEEESQIKFAFFSSAWGANTDDGMRVLVHNQSDQEIRLLSIEFLGSGNEATPVDVQLNLDVRAQRYAEIELDYIDLLSGDECVDRTLSENWKLAEISNYTLNPSVRNLIIEDTDSFRIYQCVQTVRTRFTSLPDNTMHEYDEWVLFHFESRVQ